MVKYCEHWENKQYQQSKRQKIKNEKVRTPNYFQVPTVSNPEILQVPGVSTVSNHKKLRVRRYLQYRTQVYPEGSQYSQEPQKSSYTAVKRTQSSRTTDWEVNTPHTSFRYAVHRHNDTAVYWQSNILAEQEPPVKTISAVRVSQLRSLRAR